MEVIHESFQKVKTISTDDEKVRVNKPCRNYLDQLTELSQLFDELQGEH